MHAPFLSPSPASTAPARLANHSLLLVTPNPFSCFPPPTTTSLPPVYQLPMASRITVERLRSLLKERGLPTNGFKPALVERCRANGVALGGRADDLPLAPGSSSTPGTPESGPPRSSPALAPSSAVAGDDGSGLGANRDIRPAALGGTPAEASDQAGWTAPAGEWRMHRRPSRWVRVRHAPFRGRRWHLMPLPPNIRGPSARAARLRVARGRRLVGPPTSRSTRGCVSPTFCVSQRWLLGS